MAVSFRRSATSSRSFVSRNEDCFCRHYGTQSSYIIPFGNATRLVLELTWSRRWLRGACLRVVGRAKHDAHLMHAPIVLEWNRRRVDG